MHAFNIQIVFKTLSSIVSLYIFLCFLRIFITWIPSIEYSPFGRFLSSMCDPFLNLFRGFGFLRFSMIDFTPIVAFSVLYFLSAIFSALGYGKIISIGDVLFLFIGMVSSIISSVIKIFIIFLVIRLVFLFIERNSRSYGSFFDNIDYSLNPFILKATSVFSGKRPMSYTSALIIAIIMLIFASIVFRFAFALLGNLVSCIHF